MARDVRDFLLMMRLNLGHGAERPVFDRFDYRQKFQYYAIFLAGSTMILSGLALWFATEAMAVMPKWLFDTLAVRHGRESIVILLVLFVWHLYDVHLRPEVFPMDWSWITALVTKPVTRTVKSILTWQERRKLMKGVCLNCHNDTYVDNCYKQFDDLVILYNEKFAKPAQEFMNKLTADKILNPNAPFEHEVQWVFYELWHHEGRRARHGASMMGPDYTHWHGMYEVSKHYYQKFLPEVVNAAATKGPAMKQKYEQLVREHLTKEEHLWQKGLKPGEAEALRKSYEERYK